MIYGVILVVVIVLVWYVSEYKKAIQSQTAQMGRKLQCGACGSDNISITLNQVQHVTTGKSKVVKRSGLERAANKTGRKMANTMTLGLYGAFVPKQGDYKEIQKSKTNIVNQKVAICQNCGNSWLVG